MDIRQLAYFVAVYEQGSISAAARHTKVAQPSVSSALAQLEQQLGCSLFTRQPKGVRPTDEGERLYSQASQLLSQMQALQASFRQPARRVQFRLGLVRALGVERMSALLKEFNNQVDGLELHLVEPDEPCEARIINIRQLRAGELFRPLWTDHYVLALPSQHPLCTTPHITLNDFRKLALIKRTPCEAWDQLALALSKANIKPQIRANIHTIEYAIGLVGAGIGAALLPDFEMQKFRPDLQYRPIAELQPQRELVLAFAKDFQHQPTIQALCQVVDSMRA